jgi:hypothetical protein
MYNICYHLLQIQKPYNTEDLNFQEYGGLSGPVEETIPELIEVLDEMIGDSYTDLEIFPECYGNQREIFMKFKYNGLECQILEHFDTQMDYLCVRIKEV